MTEKAVSLDNVLTSALQLDPADKAQLIERLALSLEHDLKSMRPAPKRSLLGLCADLGPAPSAEDIDAARHEAWGNFPREDV